jgi:hypothetical protein
MEDLEDRIKAAGRTLQKDAQMLDANRLFETTYRQTLYFEPKHWQISKPSMYQSSLDTKDLGQELIEADGA